MENVAQYLSIYELWHRCDWIKCNEVSIKIGIYTFSHPEMGDVDVINCRFSKSCGPHKYEIGAPLIGNFSASQIQEPSPKKSIGVYSIKNWLHTNTHIQSDKWAFRCPFVVSLNCRNGFCTGKMFTRKSNLSTNYTIVPLDFACLHFPETLIEIGSVLHVVCVFVRERECVCLCECVTTMTVKMRNTEWQTTRARASV